MTLLPKNKFSLIKNLLHILLFCGISIAAKAQQYQLYFIIGDSVEVKKSANFDSPTVNRVGYGRAFPARKINDNWMEIKEIDSSLY